MSTPSPSSPFITSSSHGLSTKPVARENSTRRRKLIHAEQLRAFVEATDALEIDGETLEDLTSDWPDLEDFVLDVSNIDVDAETIFAFPDATPSRDDDMFDARVFGGEEAARAASWSKHEINRMRRHLKVHGMAAFLREYIEVRALPIHNLLCAFGVLLCDELQKKTKKTQLWMLKAVLFRDLRDKLPQYNTVDDAVELIRSSRRILILTGAGINLAFSSFARQIYPSNFIPSPCHRFIKAIEDKGQLLRNYTQNIDTLETLAGVRNVLQCHGSFATASCLQCHQRVPGSHIESDIFRGNVPLCKLCNAPGAKKTRPRRKRGKRRSDEEEEEPDYPPGIMKPDITFFGEKLSDSFDKLRDADRQDVDLIIIIGTSLKVAPVGDMLAYMPHSVPQILINKTPIAHINPDIILLGSADAIVQHLCSKLDWELPPYTPPEQPAARPVRRKRRSEPVAVEPERIGNSHVWLFEEAEGGEWLKRFEAAVLASELAPPLASTSSSESTLVDQPTSAREARNTKKARFG
ncbi:hypothetical protein EWM64_g372 [Hericium alpestre]|uniref:Deacetylase sirtuin-type domain-containing protein n=1 Tax=Hericium alpestre TaxID=135208 RepID=A0A4Z0AAS1_9AGAM|nr:hypothetical protein EWM64_g372 [Hericium alpestre]